MIKEVKTESEKTKMNTLVLYYSYSGHTKAIAEELAKEDIKA